MLDALVSVQMVTADAKLVTASATENSDLFWALRGAGANFGIVTSATYQVYDITNDGQAMVADLIFLPTMNQSFFQTLQGFDDVLPPKLALTAVAVYNRTLEMVRDFHWHRSRFARKHDLSDNVYQAHDGPPRRVLWSTGRG